MSYLLAGSTIIVVIGIAVLLQTHVGKALKSVPALVEFGAALAYVVRELRRLVAMQLVSLASRLTPSEDESSRRLLGHVLLFLARQGDPKWDEQRDALRGKSAP